MLVLTRGVGESIAIGNEVWVKILEVRGNQVRFGVQAPKHIEIHRAEVFRRIMAQAAKQAALPPEPCEHP
ncbi:carbon storage regulator [Pseudomonas sp. M47T1]|uniref:carbon storage regulator CsrA n=1 Tax=unclassified Pseudomonas TaxID=196821 RepID=UPI0002606B2E|nr:carbon storage regulator CsrA [Pseudomonas sp. M47T1]EIK97924.1 carbon storage regulator [Pseudomonas sp. M47T1]